MKSALRIMSLALFALCLFCACQSEEKPTSATKTTVTVKADQSIEINGDQCQVADLETKLRSVGTGAETSVVLVVEKDAKMELVNKVQGVLRSVNAQKISYSAQDI